MVSRNSGLKFDFCPENVSILFFQMIVYFVFLRKKSVNKFEPFEELIFSSFRSGLHVEVPKMSDSKNTYRFNFLPISQSEIFRVSISLLSNLQLRKT